MEKPTGYCVAAGLPATRWATCHETIVTILRNTPKGSCTRIFGLRVASGPHTRWPDAPQQRRCQ